MGAALSGESRAAAGVAPARWLVAALAAAALAGAVAWMSMSPGGWAKDFSLPLTAARHLLAGRDPYGAMRPTGVYPFNVPFYYPLPAAVLAMPFTVLPTVAAGVAFVAISFGVAAYLLAREGKGRLPILLGFPALMAAVLGQWSPLLVAATILPLLQVVVPVKPTLGAAVLASRPSRVGLTAALALVVVSFAIMPGWFAAWRGAVSTAWDMYTPPVRWLGGAGVVLLASLLWWRDRDARLIAVMAVAPQLPLFYDQLLLHSAARTRREAWLLVAAGWAGGLAWALQGSGVDGAERPARGLILASIYLPALMVVVARNRSVGGQNWSVWGQSHFGPFGRKPERNAAPGGAAPDDVAPGGAAPDGAAPDRAAPDGTAPQAGAPEAGAPDASARGRLG